MIGSMESPGIMYRAMNDLFLKIEKHRNTKEITVRS
jgi:hypothetical protein